MCANSETVVVFPLLPVTAMTVADVILRLIFARSSFVFAFICLRSVLSRFVDFLIASIICAPCNDHSRTFFITGADQSCCSNAMFPKKLHHGAD